MNDQDLLARVYAYNALLHDALATILSALNEGQRKKLLKDTQVQNLLRRYGITL